MSLIKNAAAESLALFLQDAIPELSSKIFALWSDEEAQAIFPSVAILPGDMKLNPWGEDELDDSDPNLLITSVGDFTGEFEIRVYAKSVPERSKIEQRITDAFLSREGSPGVVVTETEPLELFVPGVGDAVTLFSAACSFTMEDSEWHEERVFDKKRMSFMNIECMYPALVARQCATIETLEIAISNDLNSTVPDETVIVDEDGNLTPG